MTGYKRKVFGKTPRGEGGFTLIELMIVVVIISILAAIAYPAYQQYARETKRSDAHAALLRISTLQEKFFSNNQGYATSATALGYAANPAASPEGFWSIQITGVGPAAFTLNATPAGGHADPDCPAISLTSAGMRAPANCW